MEQLRLGFHHGSRRCSKCRTAPCRAGGQRYCRECHNATMRRLRPKHSELSHVERWKSNARAYAKVYQRRGKLAPRPCESCGAPEAEKHHPDYDRPLFVEWLCARCHRAHHKALEARRAA